MPARRECRTIQKACENIVNEHMEDMAESLYKRDAATLEKFSNRVCTCGNQPVCRVHLGRRRTCAGPGPVPSPVPLILH